MTTVRTPAIASRMSARLSATPTVIGLVGFLTLVDLFAAQAILPTLATRFQAGPSEIGLAANASTLGMALSGFLTAFFGGRIDRRAGAALCLALLAIPTAGLAVVEDLSAFAALRVAQGIFMAAAFSLTMAYLAERCTAAGSATALAAYVTGSVASNLVGRLVASTVTQAAGVSVNFALFAALNLAGALLVMLAFRMATPLSGGTEPRRAPLTILADHARNPSLRRGFAIGFLILFAFIGVFTYVSFVLAREPLALSPAALGLVYFVFLPSMITTPFAGRIATRFGARLSFVVSLAIAILGLPMLLSASVPIVLAGLVIVGVGTFFAQATATGFVGRAALRDRGAASGMYLASYYLGGLAGAAVLGRVYESAGWPTTVGVVALSLVAAAALAATLPGATAEPAKD